jgi:hypothetical protein
METVFDVLNEWLFNNELYPCELIVDTTGKFASGETLGFFNFAREAGCNRRTRKLSFVDYDGVKKYVTSFEQLVDGLKPRIALNGNYTATEYSLAATLAHEMCHYYVCKTLCWPARPHGTEFKNVARMVEYRSNGYFKIQTTATAEEMSGYELDKEVQDKVDAKKERLLANKAQKLTAIFRFTTNGEVHLTPTTLDSVRQTVIDVAMRYPDKYKSIVFVNNIDLNKWILKHNYRPIIKLGYYPVTDIFHDEEYVRSNYGGRVAWRNKELSNESMKSKKHLIDEAIDKAVNRFIMREFHENKYDNEDVVESDDDIVTIPTDANLSIENV